MSPYVIPIAAVAWLTISLIFGISRAVWCGYTGEEADARADMLFILGWPALIAAVPVYCAIMVLASPFYLAHWIGRVIAKQRTEGAVA